MNPGCIYCTQKEKDYFEAIRRFDESSPFPEAVVWPGDDADLVDGVPESCRCRACGSQWLFEHKEIFIDPRETTFESPYVRWIAKRVRPA